MSQLAPSPIGHAPLDVHFPLDDEPCCWIDDRTCHRLMTDDPVGLLDALRDDLVAVAEGRLAIELPPKQLFADHDTAPDSDHGMAGDFRVMPCVVRGGGRLTKTVKVIGTNRQRRQVPGRMSVGRALLLDPVENFVAAEFAAFALSSARTGACAALAVRALAAPDERSALIHGAGPVGWYCAFYLLAAGLVDRVGFVDPDPARQRAAGRVLAARFSEAGRVSEGAFDAAVVIAATDSRRPFLHPASCGASLVLSLGADADTQSELDPAWVEAAELFTDHVDSGLIGDLRQWRAAGRLAGREVLELAGLLAGVHRPVGRRVFISTGSALLDNLSIHYLQGRLRGEAVGESAVWFSDRPAANPPS